MPVETVRTPVLDVACAVEGPGDGVPLVLLHGWPDAPTTWDAVLPQLHAAGFRTFAPALRGYGGTRFREAATPRSGQLSALGQDLLDLVDALGLPPCPVVGHDWGARAAYIGACVAPERFTRVVALSVGWGTNQPGQRLSLRQTQSYWYHWLMALPRGEALVRHEPRAFTRYIWEIWTVRGGVDEAAFAEAARAFDNPDWAEVVLHSYRVRWGHAEPDPAYAALEARLAADEVIRAPTLVIHGAADPVNEPATSEGKEALFSGPYRRVLLPGVGHFPQREAPEETAREILAFLAA